MMYVYLTMKAYLIAR